MKNAEILLNREFKLVIYLVSVTQKRYEFYICTFFYFAVSVAQLDRAIGGVFESPRERQNPCRKPFFDDLRHCFFSHIRQIWRNLTIRKFWRACFMHFIHDKFCLKNLVSCFSNSVIIWTTFMAQRTLNIKCTHNIINELILKFTAYVSMKNAYFWEIYTAV